MMGFKYILEQASKVSININKNQDLTAKKLVWVHILKSKN